jgi:hypothetical protein
MGLSLRQAAEALGISHPALIKATKTGRVSREKDGTYDVAKVRRQLAENTNALKRRTSKKKAVESGNQPFGSVTSPIAIAVTEIDDSESGDRTLAEAQRQREWIRVQKDELELARRRGELAPIGEINAFVAGMIIHARDILMRIPSELKDRLAQQGNPHECEKLVVGEITRALNELAEFKPRSQ